jgi:hypothetical protein
VTEAHAGIALEVEAQLAAGRRVGGGEADEALAHEPVGRPEVGHRVVVAVSIGAVERIHGVPEHDVGLDEDPMPAAASRQAQEEYVRLVDELSTVVVGLEKERLAPRAGDIGQRLAAN